MADNGKEKLILDFLDGLLDDQGIDKLDGLLRSDPGVVLMLIREAVVCDQLRRAFSHRDHRIAQLSDENIDLNDSTADFIDMLQTLGAPSESASVVDISNEVQRRVELKNKEEQKLTGLRTTHEQEINPVRHYVIPKAVFYGAIAAVVALTAMLFWPNQSPTPQVIEDQPTAPQLVQVATLIEQVDAKWIGEHNKLTAGDALLNQPMHLVSGLAKLRFNNEAEVILEAPCSIEPISGGEIEITQGKLVGRCETAASKGFVVQTPSAKVVDLGTAFAIQVNDDEKTEIHVLDGNVSLSSESPSQAVTHVLTKGEAFAADKSGLRPAVFNKQAFLTYVPSTYELAVRRSNPLAYWPFNEPADSEMVRSIGRLEINGRVSDKSNLGVESVTIALGTAIQGVGHLDGLEIPSADIERFVEGLSVEAWVRFGARIQGVPALASTRDLKNPDDAPPGSGFVVGLTGYNNVNDAPPHHLAFSSFGVKDFISTDPLPVNQWSHVVVTVSQNGHPRMYVNGNEVAVSLRTEASPDGYVPLDQTWREPMRMSGLNLTLGRYPQTFTKPDVELFDGGFDEAAIYDRELTAREIAAHYQAAIENQRPQAR